MKKLKTFGRTFWKSISSLSYYKDITKAKLSFSLKYFFFLFFLISLISATLTSIPIITEAAPIIKRVTKHARDYFPDDLVIEIKKGKLSVNQDEPFKIPVPMELLSDKPVAISDQNRMYLFTFDSSARLNDFDKYRSLIVANSDVLMIMDDNEGIRAFPLKEAEDITIDKAFIDSIYNKTAPYIKYTAPAIAVFLFAGFLVFIPFGKLSWVFFMSVLVYLVGNYVIRYKASFGKYFQLGLHSVTLPALVQPGMFLFDLNKPFSGFFSVFFLLYTLIIVAHVKGK